MGAVMSGIEKVLPKSRHEVSTAVFGAMASMFSLMFFQAFQLS